MTPRSDPHRNTTRLTRVVGWCSLAIAIWLSDRWMWTAPGLLGVIGGTLISRRFLQLGTLLIMGGFVYLYVVFLILELGRAGQPSIIGLWLGVIWLPLLLVGLAGALLGKHSVPRWLSRFWDELLKDR